MDAGYTTGEVMDALSSDSLKFVGRLRGNVKLDGLAAEHVSRPPGRPPREGYEYCVDLGNYQADSWEHAQRLILVVVDQPDPVSGQLNLMPHYFFLVTNWKADERTPEQLLAHYRPRGTFEDRLGEFNQAIGVHLSSQSFSENETSMLMAMLAFNLANVVRNEHEDVQGSCTDLGRFQAYVLNAGAQVVKHSRRLIVRVAQSVQAFWESVCGRIANWRLPERLRANSSLNRSALRPAPRHSHLQEVLRS